MTNKWVIEEVRGTFDIRLNRRSFASYCADLFEAVALVKRSKKYHKGDSIIVIDGIGNQVKLR